MDGTKAKNIDEYISGFPKDIQERLQQIRETIHKAAPDAKEVISYSMPAFKQNRVLVYFAVHTNHIGFYPTGSGIEAFKKEIAAYTHSKGAIQFPLNEPLPLELIDKITRFRVKLDKENASLKKAE
jgi:uncharacterized protein YdhG (YjbR/CyaY superfamily)